MSTIAENIALMTTPDPQPRVLVIDDDDNVRAVLEDFLAVRGYVAIPATNGVAGIAAVPAHSPDAVLLDIAMPGSLDGVGALRAIKRIRPELPVIMVTANVDEALARGTLRDGAFDYVMKPVNMLRLREILAAALMLSGKVPPA